MKVISKEGEWYKITYKSYTGYIRDDMIKVDGSIEENTTNTSSNKTSTNDTTNSTTTSSTENNVTESGNEQTQNTTSLNNNTTESENKVNESGTATQNLETNKEVLQKGYKGTLSISIGVKLLPTINSTIIETLPENTQFTITDVINKWGYIETESINGWVLISKIESKTDNNVGDTTKNIEISDENSQDDENKEQENKESTEKDTKTTADSKEETAKEEKITYKYVSAETLNLRETPDNDAKIITQLTLNTQVTVLETVDSTWTKVKSKNSTGYVASKFLSDSKTEKTSRSESETRTNSETDNGESSSKNLNKDSVNDNKESNSSSNTTSSTNKSTADILSGTTTSNNENNSNKSSTSGVTGASVVAYAKQYLGYKYVSGGASPTTGFDCSGFTSYVYKHFGITINRTSSAQNSNGTAVSRSNLKEGDIIIFNNSSNTAIGHVGIYIGGNTFIHAANSSKGVITTSLSDSYYSKRYVSARRIIN